ncbi:MAG: TorF family putative porin [Burkholderiales bacterium]
MSRHALLACGLLVGGAAHAQFGISVGVESDNRFRGVSLSDGQPDLRVSVAWDHDSGVFAGASATGVEFTRGRRTVQWLGYAGVVKRLTPELGVEAGVTGSTFSGDTRYDYAEAFIGLSGERWSLRAYYAPDYFGFRQATAYIELDANAPLTSRWRLFGHVGALSALSGPSDDGRDRVRTDVRIGIGFNASPSVDLQLAWVTATRGGPYVVDYGTRRSTWVLGATASF